MQLNLLVSLSRLCNKFYITSIFKYSFHILFQHMGLILFYILKFNLNCKTFKHLNVLMLYDDIVAQFVLNQYEKQKIILDFFADLLTEVHETKIFGVVKFAATVVNRHLFLFLRTNHSSEFLRFIASYFQTSVDSILVFIPNSPT